MTQDDLVLCAFRYCMGRMSYIVSDMCRHLKHHWEEICPPFRKLIMEEIENAIDREDYGMEMDRVCWERTLEYLKEKEHSMGIENLAEKESC